MGKTDVPVDPEQGVHRTADGRPAGRPDHTAQLLRGPAGRAGHGGERARRAGADGHAGYAQMGPEAGADAVPGMRAPSVRRRRVLGVRRSDGHPAGEPPHGHVQDGSGLGPRHGGRPGAPRARCAQPARDGRLRVPDRAQLQPDRARHHGGREGLGHGQADVGRVRAREQQRAAAAVVRRATRAPLTGCPEVDDKRFRGGEKKQK